MLRKTRHPIRYSPTGIFGTDMRCDPQTSTVFHYAVGLQTTILHENPYVPSGALFNTQGYPVSNTSIVAWDAVTGSTKWIYFYSIGQQRAHMIVTPGLVMSGFTDGYFRALDSDTGKALFKKNLGSAITVGPSIGADSDGNMKIFVDVGTRVANMEA
ncbi:MAG: hypothetical protein M1503_03610 [Thaumarchaeota archaeon]|nr:hypothetical protein [Nitrososphaerota archaeon]MCL5317340.1 hypothetical protein [Nitrososphaerota archaeon]